MINQFYIDYIKAIENPDRVGWNGKVWTAPQYKGYDKNQRGYGIDIIKNDSAKRLTQNRPGQWLTEGEADKLMKEHLLYVYGAALKHIKGFDNLSDRRKAALLGMLYRGDSVNKNKHIININEPDDNKFFESISNYYKSKGLNERARNSSNFFSNKQTKFLIPMKWEQWEPPMKFKNGGQVRKMQTASGGPIHYSRTMTSDNLSKAANYVGEYVLKGLGTLGRFLNAGFTSPTYGTTGQVSYARNAEDTKRLRELSEASEQAMGKVMTWVSPLNYGAAIWNGHGLDARKGEEEVASWSPAWQAVGRLGELYVGPKAVKGVKATPRVVVNTAAKAGVKPAKAAVVAREIKLGIKLNTKNGKIEVTEDYFNSPDKWYRVSERPEKIGIELNGKNVTTSDDPGINGTINGWRESMLSLTGRTIPGKGIDEGYFIFLPRKISLSKHGAAHGNTSQAAKGLIWLGTFAFSDKFPIGVIEGLAPVKIFRGMNNLGKDSRTNFVLLNWEDVPLGARVGFHTGEMPMSNLGWFLKTKNGTYTYEPIISEKRITYLPILLLDSPTSLKFFERKPSKISEAERLGVPKGGRGNLSLNQRQAIEDLALYRNSGQYRQVFRVTPDWEDFGWNLSRNNPTFMLQFSADGESMRGPWARVVLKTPTGKGIVSWNPEKNMGGYSSRMFKLPLELKYSPGEANMMLEGPNQKVILTSPRVDIQDFMDDLAKGTIEDLNLFKSLDSQLKRTIDKDVMKDFWINSRKVQRPGSYMSGDNGRAPLGSTLIEAFKNKRLHKTPILERPIDLQTIRRTGLSPDSYSSIIRLGNRDGSLRWGEGFTNWNNSAIENKFVSDALRLLKNGEITPEQYEKIFNEWSLSIGGRPLLWTIIQGLKIPVHPHPYIYAKKQGGKMNILEFLQKGTSKNGITINKSVPEIIVVPNKLYLDTFYPVISNDYPITGHSRIVGLAFTEDGFKEAEIDKLMDDAGYNLVTNNCADATRCALENISGKKMNPYFFTTPGDVLSFFKKNFDVRKSTNSSFGNPVYYTNISEADFDKIKNLEQQLLEANERMILKQFKQLTLNKKDGGKMNILEFLKNGSGIHIKEKNRGSFTRWCGGNVTEECIRRGKASSNPKIRKKATFADNARHFKHKEGGIIKALEGTKTNFFLKANNFLNSDLGKNLSNNLINGIGNIVSSVKATKAVNAQNEALDALLKAYKAKTFIDKYNENLQNQTDKSSIVRQSNAWNLASSQASSEDEFEKEINRQKLINEESARQALTDAWYTAASNIAGTAMNALSENGVPKTVSSPSYFDNYVNTLFKKSGTINSDGSINLDLGTYKIGEGYKPKKLQTFNI